MNNQAYYYTSVSGRTTFVTFQKGKDGAEWTNQKMSVKRSSISDLKPFSELKGSRVKFGEFEGIITGCNPMDLFLTGEYIGDGKYKGRKDLLNFNHLVSVHWTKYPAKTKGIPNVWQPFYKLQLI